MYSRRTLKPPKLLLQTNATTFLWCPHRPIDFTGDAKATFALARQRAQSAPHVRMPVGRQESGQSHLVLCGGNSFTFQPCHFPGILAGWRRPWSLRDLRRWEFLLFGCPAWSQGINSFIYVYIYMNLWTTQAKLVHERYCCFCCCVGIVKKIIEAKPA